MFYEEHKIKSRVNCIKCHLRLNAAPRILPCGDTVCSRCLATIHTVKNKFECLICGKKHVISEEGLPVNKMALDFLSMQPGSRIIEREAKHDAQD